MRGDLGYPTVRPRWFRCRLACQNSAPIDVGDSDGEDGKEAGGLGLQPLPRGSGVCGEPVFLRTVQAGEAPPCGDSTCSSTLRARNSLTRCRPCPCCDIPCVESSMSRLTARISPSLFCGDATGDSNAFASSSKSLPASLRARRGVPGGQAVLLTLAGANGLRANFANTTLSLGLTQLSCLVPTRGDRGLAPGRAAGSMGLSVACNRADDDMAPGPFHEADMCRPPLCSSNAEHCDRAGLNSLRASNHSFAHRRRWPPDGLPPSAA